MKILITGALSGIGFLTGAVLKKRGHEVVMAVHKNSELETLNEKLKKLNLKIDTIVLDITSKSDRDIIKKLDVDVLINNAAVGVGGSILDLDMEKVRDCFEVNFFSSFELAKDFCKEVLNNNKKGKLIVISSLASKIPIDFLGGYCSSKAAVLMMTKCFRNEIKKISKNITISCVLPGMYKTGFNEYMINEFYDNTHEDSIFYLKKNRFYESLKNKFEFLEKKSLVSIVSQIVLAVETDKNSFIYSAPLTEWIFSKIYTCLFL